MATPLSLYIHIPWCRTRCGYCDFTTFELEESRRAETVMPYISALCMEIGRAKVGVEDAEVVTIYFGGGTPTLLRAKDFEKILASVHESFSLSPTVEITTEANPETLSLEYLSDLNKLGINRLSMGMQSAALHVLNTLERVHSPGRVLEAAQWARAAGFKNLSLDLIYGTPGETMEDWEYSLRVALDTDPDHISAYSLTVEQGTPLARRITEGYLDDVDQDDMAEKYLLADEILSAAGLPWYEVSNWARPGFECQHNLQYWHSGQWRGIGVGAHSFDGRSRWWAPRSPAKYVATLNVGESPVLGRELLTEDQKRTERIMLGIRLAEGFESNLLTETELNRAQRFLISGDLLRSGTRLVCTLRGRLIADLIVREILD
ncbi:MAG: radical SAM family heme chaperone HemW [Propionibacteriaceae bacterium]|nr:radical SAM family heme chaperone HemW [Propionibacteriaceae bacterium]